MIRPPQTIDPFERMKWEQDVANLLNQLKTQIEALQQSFEDHRDDTTAHGLGS